MSSTPRTLLLGLGGLVVLALAIAVAGRLGSDGSDTATTPSSSPSTSTTTAGTSTSTTSTTSSTTTTTTLSPLEEDRNRIAAVADALVGSMNDEELAYQLIATGLTGADVRSRLDDTVGSPCVGAVFVTETNANWAPLESAEAAATSIGLVRRKALGCPTDPLIATDAEFGSIVRVPVESPAAPPEWTRRYETGAPADVLVAIGAEAFDYATALRDIGVDLNFGVVADVDVDPSHFMARSGRTFGADESITAALTGAIASAHCQAGVAPTLKHFPNQGSTVEDPHREPSVSVGGLEGFQRGQDAPWINTPAPAVMTGHIVMPDIDPDLPASLSPDVTDGLLRRAMGYEGVVITDDLSTMRGAIEFAPDVGERAVAAIGAGADLALFVDDRDVGAAVDALTAAMAEPTFRERATRSVTRTMLLRLALAEPDRFPICLETR